MKLQVRNVRDKGRSLCILILMGYLALTVPPYLPRAVKSGLDPSWFLGLSWAIEQGLEFGQDIVFTYGPLAHLFVTTVANPYVETAMAAQMFIYCLWVACVIGFVLRNRWDNWMVWCATVIFLVGLLSTSIIPHVELVALSLGVLSFLWGKDSRPSMIAAALGLGALLLLVKLTWGILLTALIVANIGIASIREEVSKKKVALLIAELGWGGLFFFGTLIVGFGLANNSFSGLQGFLMNSWEVIRGYSAMSRTAPEWSLWAIGLSLGVLFVGIPAVAQDRRSLQWGMIPALIVAFFAVKSLMRFDAGHFLPFFGRIAIASLFLMCSAVRQRDRLLLAGFQVGMLCLGLISIWILLPVHLDTIWARVKLEKFDQYQEGVRNWPATKQRLLGESSEWLRPLKLDPRFDAIVGEESVDVVPWEVAMVYANDWKWGPRPVFQSYSAYTPRLDRLNAEHIESAAAARYVFANLDAIDGRHPFLENPLGWRALLNWYELALSPDRPILFLQRRDEPLYGKAEALGNAEFTAFGQELAVPLIDDLVLMRCDVTPSLFGHLLGAAYKRDHVFLKARYESGNVGRWRLVGRNLKHAAIVSQLPRELQDLERLTYAGRAARDRVVAITLETEGASQFQQSFSVQWYRMAVRQRWGRPSLPDPVQSNQFVPLWLPGSNGTPRPEFINLELVTRRGFATIVPTSDDPKIILPRAEGADKLFRIVVRARYERDETVQFFFGRQSEGRHLTGRVRDSNQWVDLHFNLEHNPFWAAEGQGTLRLDPATGLSVGRAVDIAGIWGSTARMTAEGPSMQTRLLGQDNPF